MSSTSVADRTVDDEFLDLICSNADLLASEFDAIVAAEWPEPPPPLRGRRSRDRHPHRDSAHEGADPVRGPAPRHPRPAIDARARQRSPPTTS